MKVPGGTAKIRIIVTNLKSEKFRNSGIDVHTETMITAQEALSGVVKKVKTLNSVIDVNVCFDLIYYFNFEIKSRLCIMNDFFCVVFNFRYHQVLGQGEWLSWKDMAYKNPIHLEIGVLSFCTFEFKDEI